MWALMLTDGATHEALRELRCAAHVAARAQLRCDLGRWRRSFGPHGISTRRCPRIWCYLHCMRTMSCCLWRGAVDGHEGGHAGGALRGGGLTLTAARSSGTAMTSFAKRTWSVVDIGHLACGRAYRYAQGSAARTRPRRMLRPRERRWLFKRLPTRGSHKGTHAYGGKGLQGSTITNCTTCTRGAPAGLPTLSALCAV